jgi:hypothetical protein
MATDASSSAASEGGSPDALVSALGGPAVVAVSAVSAAEAAVFADARAEAAAEAAAEQAEIAATIAAMAAAAASSEAGDSLIAVGGGDGSASADDAGATAADVAAGRWISTSASVIIAAPVATAYAEFLDVSARARRVLSFVVRAGGRRRSFRCRFVSLRLFEPRERWVKVQERGRKVERTRGREKEKETENDKEKDKPRNRER